MIVYVVLIRVLSAISGAFCDASDWIDHGPLEWLVRKAGGGALLDEKGWR